MRDNKLENYYCNRAPEYEQIYYRDNPERRQEIDDEVSFLKELCTGKDVLDIACGTGYWTKHISETAASIVACDISDEMITQAQQKHYHCPVQFIRSNLNQLPFIPNSFDIVILGFWFSHHPRQDYKTLFNSISNPLKAGCPIWMIENNPPAEGSVNNSHHIDNQGNNYKKRLLDNSEEFIILKNYFKKDELTAIFSPFFKIERLVYKTYYWSVLLHKYR
jgi:ubiquinone/menaquinone biosynthesis C-methylase UbiE